MKPAEFGAVAADCRLHTARVVQLFLLNPRRSKLPAHPITAIPCVTHSHISKYIQGPGQSPVASSTTLRHVGSISVWLLLNFSSIHQSAICYGGPLDDGTKAGGGDVMMVPYSHKMAKLVTAT